MCGLSGFISKKNQPIDTIINLNKLIKHRGPDDEGYFLHDIDKNIKYNFLGNDSSDETRKKLDQKYQTIQNVSIDNFKSKFAFGHRRLSIVDLTYKGHQPFTIDDNFTIIYNGEIYNYEIIKDELKNLGHKFFSKTDTEVFLRSFIQWGKDCFNKFNGMWSAAIYNKSDQTLLISRDRFGVKPLYYWIHNNETFFFASEIKQFTKLKEWSPKLNLIRANDFLINGLLDHTNETLFDGVYQLLGGHYIEIDYNKSKKFINKDIYPIKWYHPKKSTVNTNFKNSILSFKKYFNESVKIRSNSEVKLSVSLSGGIDSSSILMTLLEFNKNKKEQKKIESFSSCSHDKEFDERQYINVLKDPNLIKNFVFPNFDDFMKDIDKTIWIQDEPYLGSSIFAEYSIYKAMKDKNYKISLDGHGADEIFYGYESFIFLNNYNNLKRFKIISLIKSIINLKKYRNYNYIFTIKNTFKYFFKTYLIFRILNFLKYKKINPSWLNNQFKKTDNKNLFFEKKLNNLSFNQLIKTTLPVQLHWADRDSMYHSIESRSPYLDYRIIELIMNLPNEYKIKDDITKYILRESVKGLIPYQIYSRNDKMGYVTPEKKWFIENREKILNEIKNSINNSLGILNNNALKIAEKLLINVDTYDPVALRWILFSRWIKLFKVRL